MNVRSKIRPTQTISAKSTRALYWFRSSLLMLFNAAVLISYQVHASTDETLQIRTYSESEIGTLITLPTTPKQLLQNLKNAWDHDWLVQSTFFADANLLKFFNATKVSWEQDSKPGQAPSFGNGQLTINSQVFPKMTVELVRGILRKSEHGGDAAYSGFIIIRVESMTGLNVGLVKEIFGEESKDELDFGIATDAHGYTPTTAGDLLYENYNKETSTAPFQEYRARFVVKKTKPGMPTLGSKFLTSEPIEGMSIFQSER